MLFKDGIFRLPLHKLLFVSVFFLSGCAFSTTTSDAPVAGAGLQGRVYGGETPISGQHIYLLAATVSGVGSAGYGLASTSLLSSTLTGHSDSIGAYVLTNSDGTFSLNSSGPTYFYTCPTASTQVYLYGIGGNTGSGVNGGASLMAALGPCGNLSSSTYVQMNELTTVASAYALSGFATDATHVSIPQYVNTTQQTNSVTDALAATDLQNAFVTANNLVSTMNGMALTTTPGGNGTPGTAQVITLANILAACVSSYPTSNPTNCNTLYNNAGSTGGGTGTTPTNTATAAINIAHNPYVSSTVMSYLYGLAGGTGAPFAGGDTSQPADFTVGINFTGGGLNGITGIAIDGTGNIWVPNGTGNSLSKFSNSGEAITSSSGYTTGGINDPSAVAIDNSGNVWVTNLPSPSTLSELSNSGAPISSSSGYTTGGGLGYADSLAIDASGNVWVANAFGGVISEFSSSGTAITTSAGYTGGGLDNPRSIAIDGSGNVWVADNFSSGLSKFHSNGTAVSSNAGYTGGGLLSPHALALDGTGSVYVVESSNGLSKFDIFGSPFSLNAYTGGGLNSPQSVAIDGSGNIWMGNSGSNAVSEFGVDPNTGGAVAISPSSGYTAAGAGLATPSLIAVDGSGNIWAANGDNSLTELVGAATPVVTPMVANLIAPYTSSASKP